jgi:hypothetical protein
MMILEPKLGKLIRKLNPYTNGAMRTMLCGADPSNLATLGADLTTLGGAITAYVNDPSDNNLTALNQAEDSLDQHLSISDISLRVDNDFHQEYMTWIFRGQPHAVKRALRVTYRYELTDRQAAGTGIYATEHVLIGYAGSNG